MFRGKNRGNANRGVGMGALTGDGVARDGRQRSMLAAIGLKGPAGHRPHRGGPC